MNRISQVTIAPSEASVTGPYRPSNDTARPRQGWTNSDYPLAPSRPVRFDPPNPLPPVQAQPQPNPEPQQRVSIVRKLVAIAGVLCVSLGTVGGLVSIAALGPIGLAVAGGAFLIGCVLIKASAKD